MSAALPVAYRAGLPDRPKRIARLALNDRGYPVPWFVATVDGKPDFRVVRAGRREEAIRNKQCWICGGILGAYKAFLIGPMCAVNRVTSEPPCHQDCAEYAARACPFLANPTQQRRPYALPTGTHSPGGIALDRNPGVALVWTTKKFQPFAAPGGWLIEIGLPVQLMWFREGRTASRAEILESIETGMPTLREQCDAEQPNLREEANAALDRQYAKAIELVPQDGILRPEMLGDLKPAIYRYSTPGEHR
jgi:hypothetical protein